ncbi:MAG TPA: glycosyltransferase family 2 protein [Candidatus Bathyarchaeia archaeon]|nr:glycosyltransferase family 2 protein [Candidatus Bathyarchaeia archaeon]
MLEPASRIHERNIPFQVQDVEESVGPVTEKDVTIVLPVLNEEKGVVAVIDDIRSNGFPNILVVDGYSVDNTVAAAGANGVEVAGQHGGGKTGAIITAIERVSTPYLLVMDGDYTYDAADIRKFLYHANYYDEIVGARKSENISRLHRLGNGFLCALFNALLGTHFSDVCSGMYLLRTSAARHLVLQTRGFSVEAEVLAQMSLLGRATEVPINYRTRIGKAKLVTWVHGFEILKSIVELARIYNPVFLFSITTASAAIPGLAILLWVFWEWVSGFGFHNGWAITGEILLIVGIQAFFVGTLALLMKRSELRIERVVKRGIDHR